MSEDVNNKVVPAYLLCQFAGPEAHFPLLNPRDFDDLESFARHDHFVVDLRVDKADGELRTKQIDRDSIEDPRYPREGASAVLGKYQLCLPRAMGQNS